MRSHLDFDIEEYNAVLQTDGTWLHSDGDVCWYDGLGGRHREDGPAVISPNGEVEWFLYDRQYIFDQWCIKLNKPDEDKMMLRLQYA
jgi:hypothetical protein